MEGISGARGPNARKSGGGMTGALYSCGPDLTLAEWEVISAALDDAATELDSRVSAWGGRDVPRVRYWQAEAAEMRRINDRIEAEILAGAIANGMPPSGRHG